VRALNVVSHSEQQTTELARKLAVSFRDRDVIVLTGDLGAGKTVFVRGLVAGRGLDDTAVTSPTFTLVNEYPGASPVYHIDLYRLGDPSQLREIGWEDYLGRRGLTVIEWGEKGLDFLPPPYYHVHFRIVGETERDIDIVLVDE
jgi:tRNA threonylcarbamoyladenosine biosynthesis protein TsaE